MARANIEGQSAGRIRALFEVGHLGTLTDEQLLDRFRSGDERHSGPAFAALVDRHGPMVLAACRRILADPHLAEDAFQATFLVFARRAASVRDGAALGAWLHRVARRVAARAKARADRRRAREGPALAEAAAEYPDRAELGEIRAVIDEEVDRLGRDQRLPVVLCCLEGLSHEEAARRLRWPLGTVKSRLARGREKLQGRLIRRGFAPTSALAALAGPCIEGASAAVPAALVEATAGAVARSLVAGGRAVGTVPAAVSALVREEVGSVIALKVKVAGACGLAVVASVATVGLALARPMAQEPSPKSPPNPLATKATSPALAARLSVSGRVVDAGGNGIAGARVILRERAQQRLSSMPPEAQQQAVRAGEIRDTLAEAETDANGGFRFRDVAAPAFPGSEDAGRTDFPYDVVALAPGRGLAWATLTAAASPEPITLRLGDEGTIRGRVIEPGGRPVVGARIRVNGIDRLGQASVNGVGTDNRLNLNWSAFPLGATTDADGRFALGGLPRDRVATLIVVDPAHERLFAFAATTDEPQADAVGRIFHPGRTVEHRRPVYTGDFTLTARRTDHTLVGRVVFEADGKPAARARVHGGMEHVQADDEGRFRIEGLPAGNVELHVMAFGTDAAPFDGEVTVPDEPGDFSHVVRLPKGLTLMGRVADAATGHGAEGIAVAYTPKPGDDQVPTEFGFQAKTDAQGRYRLVVPSGRGTLDLTVIPQDFVQPERRSSGEPADPRFSRAVEGQAGATVEVPEFQLARGGVVVLRVVDPEGRPASGARVDIRELDRAFDKKPGRADAEGRFVLRGLEPGRATVVDLLDEGRKLGATVEVGDAGPADGLEVRLQPLVRISGRVLDEDGRPLATSRVVLYRDVNYPGQSGRSFGTPVATLDRVGADGSYAFDVLIPGATYNTQVEARGHATASGRHVRIKPGTPVELEADRLPVLDGEVSGAVVDSRGKPAPGVSVGYSQSDRTQAMYAPSDAVWFQDTDALGKFHLANLPRGPIRLQVYRHPAGPDRSIRGMQYVDVAPGQREVRIEIRDLDDRLRGID